MSTQPGSIGKASPAKRVLRVKVKPGSRVSLLSPAEDGSWIAQLRSPPVDGKANAELLALVAQHFGCRRAAVSIRSGASSRTKLVEIEGHAGAAVPAATTALGRP